MSKVPNRTKPPTAEAMGGVLSSSAAPRVRPGPAAERRSLAGGEAGWRVAGGGLRAMAKQAETSRMQWAPAVVSPLHFASLRGGPRWPQMPASACLPRPAWSPSGAVM